MKKKKNIFIAIILTISIFYLLTPYYGYYTKFVKDISGIDLEAIANENKKDDKLSGLNLIFAKGHPVYYDKIEDANSFWKEYIKDKKVIIKPGEYASLKDGDNSLIYMEGYGANERIDTIHIYLENTEEVVNIDTALSIAKDYLPLTTINSYMEVDESFIFNNLKTGSIARVITYKTTEDGYKHREETAEGNLYPIIYSYPYMICIHIWGNDDEITWIEITHEINKNIRIAKYSKEKDRYSFDEWDFNFLNN